MIHPIANRKITASLFAMAWLALVGQGPGYGQPPVEEGKIYWAGQGIHRSSLDGTNVEQLVESELRYPADIALDVLRGKMYWTDRWGEGGIYWSDLDGSNLKPFMDDDYSSIGATNIALDVDGSKIYWTTVYSAGDHLAGWVARANLDGSNGEVLLEMSHLWDIALDLVGGKVYWTDWYSDSISRADLDGQNVEYDYIRSGSPSGIALDVDRGKIYWTGWTDAGTIQRADLDGQNIEEVLTVSDGYPEEIILDVDRGKIYWTNPGTQTIQRTDLDGQNVEHLFDLEDDVKPIHSGPRTGIALDVDRGKIYWTDSGPGTIQRADLDGQNIEVLITELNRPKDIALLDGNKIYWAAEGTGKYRAEPETGKIQAANLNGTNVEDIVTGLSNLQDIALDVVQGKIYWMDIATDLAEGIIHRANLDGANVEDIVTGIAPFSPVEIALDLDTDKLYWTDQGTGTIQRADLDGTNVEGIFSLPNIGWSYFGAIALDLVGNKIYWGILASAPSMSPRWLEIFRSNLDGSQVKEIYSRFRVEGYLPAPTSIALYIPHPTSVSTSGTTPAIPATSGLDPNFPNPFNSITRIAYRLASPGPVRLEIYNTLGQPLRTLVDQVQAAGWYQVRWDARDQGGAVVAAGVYLTRLHHPSGVQTRQLLLLK